MAVATLATLILLSYMNFLSTVITIMSFVTLEYPDDSQRKLWLPDALIEYFRGKHVALIVVACIILLVGSVYTLFLLLWQWFLSHGWVPNEKLKLFFRAYHAPYNDKHCYWMGLLLVVRITLYILFTLNTGRDPAADLMGIVVVMFILMFLKALCGQVYKKWTIDALEMVTYINIVILGVVELYYTHQYGGEQSNDIIVLLSVSITAFMLFMVVVYHIITKIQPNVCTAENFWLMWNSDTREENYCNDAQEDSGSRSVLTTSVVTVPHSDDRHDNENLSDDHTPLLIKASS